jgi:hypothetical protein
MSIFKNTERIFQRDLMQNLYNNLTYMYPDSNIWLIGTLQFCVVPQFLIINKGIPLVAPLLPLLV